jgi:hypothetical protein
MYCRIFLPMTILALAGCEAAQAPIEIATAVNIGSVMVIGRTVPDAVVSAVTGRDCSAVRLDRGQTYCRATESPPAPPPYCTRSIGSIDCWKQPPLALPLPVGVADGQIMLTPAQEAHRTRRWPGLW